ncbi:MAG: type III secretion system stator protein SctL [Pseudomonadota bacterium]
MAAFLRLTTDRAALAEATGIVKATDFAQAVAAEAALEAAREEAARIVAGAETQAEAALAAAHAEADQLLSEAEERRAAAHEEGHAAGLDAASAEITRRMLDLVEHSVDYLAGTERKVARIVMMCLRKVLGEMPDEEIVLHAASAALKVVRSEPRVTLRVASEVRDAVADRIGEILQGALEVSFLEVVADDSLRPGGCRLETDAGVVDASLETQVATLERIILERVAGGGD